MKNITRSLCGLALLTLTAGALAQPAQPYPSRPVRFVIGFPAGGPTDAAGRIMAQALAQPLGQTVIIDNRPGADGAIGAELVAKATPDGHTLLLGSNSNIAGVPAMRKTPPYDAVADFVPITFVAWNSLLMVINPGVPVKTVAELISHACANLLLPHVREGRLRALAALTRKRIRPAPEVPTIVEAGIANFSIYGWFALFAPAKTPTAVIDRLDRDVNAILKRADIQDQFNKIGFEMGGPTSRPELAAFVKEQLGAWDAAAREAGIEKQ